MWKLRDIVNRLKHKFDLAYWDANAQLSPVIVTNTADFGDATTKTVLTWWLSSSPLLNKRNQRISFSGFVLIVIL